MRAKFKLINISGDSPINEFDTIELAKVWLNELYYYCEDLILNIECNYTDNFKYSEVTDLRSILSEANFYDSVVCINVIYESDPDSIV